jgi:hypothetical protein
MVSQIRVLFDEYAASGGSYREEAFADGGHTLHIGKPDAFRDVFIEFLP